MRTYGAAITCLTFLLLVPFSSISVAGTLALGTVEGRACNLSGDFFFREIGFPDVSASRGGDCGTASAQVAGFANLGLLGGLAAVSTTGSGRGAIAAFDLQWDDVFTVTSDSLPPGTPVDVQLSLFLDFDFSPSGGVAQGRLLGTLGSGRDDGFFIFSDHDIDGGDGPVFEQTVLQKRVGDTFPLVGRLFGSVGFSGGAGSVVLAAEHTARSNVDVLTPGASYTTESGHSYVTGPTAVPAPGALLLIGAGLVSLALAKKVYPARRGSKPRHGSGQRDAEVRGHSSRSLGMMREA